MIIYLDTNIVIYAVEQPALWGSKTLARLAAAVAAKDTFAISDLTRMECLVGPLRKGDAKLHGAYVAFFTQPNVSVAALTATLCDRAAQIRALHRFRTADSLQLAAQSKTVAVCFSPTTPNSHAFPMYGSRS
jgi:uncharacterized protein